MLNTTSRFLKNAVPFSQKLKASIHNSGINLKRFDQESTLTKVSDNVFRGTVSDSWSVGDAPNGGFLMYLAIQASSEICSTFKHTDPISFTAYYISKAVENTPADISVRIIGQSKSQTTVHVTMTQEGQVKSEYLGAMGNLDNFKGLNHSRKSSPELPSPEKCLNSSVILRKQFGKHLKIAHNLEMRVPHDDPSVTGLFSGKQGDKALLNAWVSLADQRLPSLSSMAFFLDCLPPPVLNLSMSSWVPTLEYTVHFWTKPTLSNTLEDKEMHHWVRAIYETSHVNNGVLSTDGEIWSHDGKELLATSRQLARLWDPPQKKPEKK